MTSPIPEFIVNNLPMNKYIRLSPTIIDKGVTNADKEPGIRIEFGDLELYPFYDKDTENTIHRLNVLDKSLKESIGLDNSSLLIGKYKFNENYIVVKIEDGEYVYKLWDGETKTTKMNFEFLLQLVALEVSYVTDYDGFMDIANEE